MADEPLVLRSDSDRVATLTLNRPDKRNALHIDLFVALDAHLATLEAETGRIGADLGRQQRGPAPHFQARTIERLARLPRPVIAAVHGPCLAGGLKLVLAADIIVAAEAARFADTHAKWGLVPGWGMSQRLPRRIGWSRASEMMFTGRSIAARRPSPAAERAGQRIRRSRSALSSAGVTPSAAT